MQEPIIYKEYSEKNHVHRFMNKENVRLDTIQIVTGVAIKKNLVLEIYQAGLNHPQVLQIAFARPLYSYYTLSEGKHLYEFKCRIPLIRYVNYKFTFPIPCELHLMGLYKNNLL